MIHKLFSENVTLSVRNGGGHWTVPELVFESKELIPALHDLLDDCQSVSGMIKYTTWRS
jgi:hypothetical protein